jgi:REP element-mobilizing transposase RayT
VPTSPSSDTFERHDRRSTRLRGYDYTAPGAYFVTIVAYQREMMFEPPHVRKIVDDCWLALAELYAPVTLDEYVVMPNHFHSILIIDEPRRGGSRTAPTPAPNPRKPLGRLIGAFKTMSAKRINLRAGTPGAPVWQRNYYERIIRDEDELNRTRQYILDNPSNWDADPENPVASSLC